MGLVALVTGDQVAEQARTIEAKLRHRIRGRRTTGVTARHTRVRLGAGAATLPAVALGSVSDGQALAPNQDWSSLRKATGLSLLEPATGRPAVLFCDGHPPDAYAMVAVWDDGRLMAARGPLGLRPLYYLERGGRPVAFASEMKALCPLGAEVRVFPPGHVYMDGRFRRVTTVADLAKADAVPPPPEVPATADAAAAELARLIDDAVERGYHSAFEGAAGKSVDAPVAIFLSGGVDSSVIAAAAVDRLGPDRIRCFSVGTVGSADLPQARLVAEHLGVFHREFIFGSAEAERVLEQVIYHLESIDPPLVRSSVANYLVAEMAAQAGCHLAYCGEGGDELFAGYSYLKRMRPRNRVAAELITLLEGGHANGFQRVDRMTAAHGLEARVPLSAPDIVAFALGVPLEWKLHPETGQEKWLLRQAYRDRLPATIVERPKAKFYEGSGMDDVMNEIADRLVAEGEFGEAVAEAAREGLRLETREQALYWRIFRKRFPQPSLLDTIGWTRTIEPAAAVAAAPSP